MKTYKNVYKCLLDKQHIKDVLLAAVDDKDYKHKVERKIDRLTEATYKAVVEKNYTILPTHTKIVRDRKKERLITLAPFFPNKALDYLIVDQINPIIMRSMYRWRVGNVRGRGLDPGVIYCQSAARKYKYCLQLDIKKFYANIDKYILYRKIARKIADKEFLQFYRGVVGSSGKGLALGLNSSQWLANFYLEGLDYYIKQTLKVSEYVAYADNMWLFSDNKRKLHFWRKQIEQYLRQNLRLSLNENYQIYNFNKGDEIEVLGYKISKGFTRLNKPTLYKISRLYFRMKKNLSPRRARTIVSLMGWLQRTTNYEKYFATRILAKVKISYATIKRIAGGKYAGIKFDRKRAVC